MSCAMSCEWAETEACLGLFQTSMVELFSQKVAGGEPSGMSFRFLFSRRLFLSIEHIHNGQRTESCGNPSFTLIQEERLPFKTIFYFKIFKDTLKAFDYFKNKQKRVWSNVFWYVKVCIFWKCIQYTIHWDKTQMLKNFLPTK